MTLSPADLMLLAASVPLAGNGLPRMTPVEQPDDVEEACWALRKQLYNDVVKSGVEPGLATRVLTRMVAELAVTAGVSAKAVIESVQCEAIACAIHRHAVGADLLSLLKGAMDDKARAD